MNSASGSLWNSSLTTTHICTSCAAHHVAQHDVPLHEPPLADADLLGPRRDGGRHGVASHRDGTTLDGVALGGERRCMGGDGQHGGCDAEGQRGGDGGFGGEEVVTGWTRGRWREGRAAGYVVHATAARERSGRFAGTRCKALMASAIEWSTPTERRALGSRHALLRGSPSMAYRGFMPIADEWTAERARALPEDGKRYEVLDGVLAVTPAPSWRHQDVAFVAATAAAGLRAAARARSGDLRPGRRRVLVATAAAARRLRRAARRDGRAPARWEEVQHLLLAVEVLSPSTARHDRHTKRGIYMAESVDEYWIVDPEARARRTVASGRGATGDRRRAARLATGWHARGARHRSGRAFPGGGGRINRGGDSFCLCRDGRCHIFGVLAAAGEPLEPTPIERVRGEALSHRFAPLRSCIVLLPPRSPPATLRSCRGARRSSSCSPQRFSRQRGLPPRRSSLRRSPPHNSSPNVLPRRQLRHPQPRRCWPRSMPAPSTTATSPTRSGGSPRSATRR